MSKRNQDNANISPDKQPIKKSQYEMNNLLQKIQELETDNQKLKLQLEHYKALPSKVAIYDSLKQILGTKPSEKTLVSMYTNENGKIEDVIILGRPEVSGSSSKQMRHVTPFSFVETIISGNSNSLLAKLNTLSNNISLFLPKHYGIRLDLDQFQKLQQKYQELKAYELYTTKSGNNNISYLIPNTILNTLPDDWKKVIDLQDVKELEKKYSSAISKLITYSIDKLKESITNSENTNNTLTILCEALSESILTYFNQMDYVAFAQESNTLPYEIRVYSNSASALKAGKKGSAEDYTIYTASEIFNNNSNDYNHRIRAVDNEGRQIGEILKVLELLDKFVSYNIIDTSPNESEINTYNQKSNFKMFKLEHHLIQNNDLSIYTKDLTSSAQPINYASHIAKYLYLAFDFKPLEQHVLVPVASESFTPNSTIKKIAVYSGATKEDSKEMLIIPGEEYRLAQKENYLVGKNLSKINNNIFRPQDMGSKEHKDLLVKKVIEHVKICVMAFDAYLSKINENYPQLILKQFSKLIDLAYSSNDYYYNYIKETTSTDKFFMLEDVSYGSAILDSTVPIAGDLLTTTDHFS